jgi:hypothetical protein
MELYLDTFYDLIKNDTNKYNYFKCREIMYKKNSNSTRIKKNTSKALEYINKIDENYTIKIFLLKHQLNYILNDFEISHKYLIKYFEKLKYFDINYCKIFYEKLNFIQLYIHINKLSNKNLFKDILNKLKKNEEILILSNKLNILGKEDTCPICFEDERLIPMECAHFYCASCYYKLKVCGVCNTKNKNATSF